MPAELVLDKLKLADINRGVFGNILGKKNDRLVGCVCDPEFEEYGLHWRR